MGLFSFIGNALFGGTKKGNSATQNSTTNVDYGPYQESQPFINSFLQDNQNWYDWSQQHPFSDLQQRGFNMVDNVANGGRSTSPTLNAASDELTKTLNGDYLTPETNPYLRDIATRISGIAGANSNATFGGRGRSSSGLAGYYSGKAVGDSLTDMYGTNYANERGRMLQAAGLVPQFEEAKYTPAQAMISAGSTITNQPYERNAQQAGILAQIGSLGRQGTESTNATTQNYRQSSGLIGKIADSLTNRLFPT